MQKKAWQTFFDSHSKRYDENAFTFATNAECDFLAQLLPIGEHHRILDIGCGTGRHSIGLTKLGYEMTGLDLSDGMLEIARKKASAAGLDIKFLKADATVGYPEEFGFAGRFDACICLCEGSLGLVSAGEEPMHQAISVFRNAACALRPGGKLVVTALSALKLVRQYNVVDIASGRFDPVNIVEWHSLFEVDPEISEDLAAQMVGEKAFTGAEIALMLKECGLKLEHIWGGTAGNWGRRTIDPDEYELMAVAAKV